MPQSRHKHWRLALVLCSTALLTAPGAATAKAPRVLEPGQTPADARLGAPRGARDKYHPWTPPATLEAWNIQREAIRQRMLVGMGLWPMPPAAPLTPVIHGKIDRDDYTVEKVFFASHPGFYVTGSLYRPKNAAGRTPGVLCPHGHWDHGRFHKASAAEAAKQMESGAEKFLCGALYSMQARCVGLARMGCTVFHYDMVGYADSKQIVHREGFTDVEAALRLHDFMGLQTFNSLRALDFLTSLPEVDPHRIGVTGASGGGTQTFVLCALDARPAAAFPAVMVSTNMQGGCVCENCNYLRVGLNNIALTALFAPRALAMSGANDWTIDIETKGLPELKKVYALYGHPELVHAKAFPQFEHNYNQVAREMMYAWFNTHLQLGRPEPVVEREFEPAAPADLSVYDAEHPRPADAVDVTRLRRHLTQVSDAQYAALVPNDSAGLAEYRRVVGSALRVMLDGGLPKVEDVAAASELVETPFDGCRLYRASATRKGAGEQVPVVGLVPPDANGTAILWIDGAGKQHLFDAEGKPTAAVRKLLSAGLAVVSADVFQTGEYLPEGAASAPAPAVNSRFAGYTFGYNRPILAERVRDIQTVIAGLRSVSKLDKLHLVGTGEAGPWVLLARTLADRSVDRCVVDLNGFGFSKITATNDPLMLPGGLKYGGIGGLAALCAPHPLLIFGTMNSPAAELAPLGQVYKAAGGTLTLVEERLSDDEVVNRLLE